MDRRDSQFGQVVEQREEVCSVASKIVAIKIYRKMPEDFRGEGEIIGFECNNSGPSCESRCTYKRLLEDY